jgi:hypothetical protein
MAGDVAAQESDADPKAPMPYEPPAIVWEEAHLTVGLVMSCNHQMLNPGCDPGPYGS